MKPKMIEMNLNPSRKILSASLLRLLVSSIVAMIVINYPYQFVEMSTSVTGTNQAFLNTKLAKFETELAKFEIYNAGWPVSFYFSRSSVNGIPCYDFDTVRFIINFTLWSGAIGTFLAYEYRVRRRSGMTAKRRMVLSDLFLLTAIVAIPFVLWTRIQFEFERERKLRDELSRVGVTMMTSRRIPIPFAMLPDFIQIRFARVSRVWLDRPETELVRTIAGLPNLEVLAVTGGQYELAALHLALKNKKLLCLQIAERELDQETLLEIGSCKRLSALNLSGTHLTAERMKAFGRLTSLESLEIQNNDVDLNDLELLECSKTIKNLVVSIPSGAEGKIAIRSWKRLADFKVKRTLTQPSQTHIDLICEDLPNLENIVLTTTQSFDVQIRNLPKLHGIVTDWRDSSGSSSTVPYSEIPRIHSFHMRNTPLLSSLVLHGNTLKQFSVDANNLLNLTLVGESPKQTASGVVPQANAPAMRTQLQVCEPLSQASLDAFAVHTGINHVALKSMSLNNLDLSKFASQASLRSLSIVDSGISYEQLLQLAGMPNLEVVHSKNIACTLTASELQYLVASLPSLKKLDCQLSFPSVLSIENHTHLQELNLRQTQPTQDVRVRLKQLPRFSESMIFEQKLKELQIDGLPRLNLLSIRSPMPQNSVLRGLKDLTGFVGGGSDFSDESARAVVQCTGLKSLTMVYAPLTQDTLRKIGNLQELEYLRLTGCSVDDSVLERVCKLTKLKTLRLDHTQITSEAIEMIGRMPQLEFLSISFTAANDGDLTPLGNLKNLRVLEIAGRRNTEDLAPLLVEMGELLSIDLSNTRFSQALLTQWFQSPYSKLRQVHLRDSQLDGNIFYDAAANTGILFSLTGSNIDKDILALLREKNQLLAEAGQLDNGSFRTNSGWILSRNYNHSPFEEIDIRRFEPSTSRSPSLGDL